MGSSDFSGITISVFLLCLDFLYKISLPAIPREDLVFVECIVIELHSSSEFDTFCQILGIHILKSRQKIPIQEILMHILSFGGLMVININLEGREIDYLFFH